MDPRRTPTLEFQCAECGELHRGSPSFSYMKPYAYFDVPEAERAARIRIDADTCAIDDELFFIRGLLEIPIIDVEEPCLWGLWVSQSQDSFARYVETMDQDQGGQGSFGWLAVTLPVYDRTAKVEPWEQLACNVNWQDNGQRPLIEPQECDHSLYTDFVNGINWDRAVDLARQIIHTD